MSASNIHASQKRDNTPPAHTVINRFEPLNGASQERHIPLTGVSTNRIIKSESKPQAGPKSSNL
jgi:hypothetical protein